MKKLLMLTFILIFLVGCSNDKVLVKDESPPVETLKGKWVKLTGDCKRKLNFIDDTYFSYDITFSKVTGTYEKIQGNKYKFTAGSEMFLADIKRINNELAEFTYDDGDLCKYVKVNDSDQSSTYIDLEGAFGKCLFVRLKYINDKYFSFSDSSLNTDGGTYQKIDKNKIQFKTDTQEWVVTIKDEDDRGFKMIKNGNECTFSRDSTDF